jgi:hypothetical protein
LPQAFPLNVTDPTSPQLNLEHLLRMGVAAARAGNRTAAHALFLALTREYPGDVRTWLGLASVATGPDEQRDSLGHVVAINPEHPQALRALASLAPAPVAERATVALPETLATPGTPSAPSPATIAAPQPEDLVDDGPIAAPGRFPLLNVIALTVIGILLLALVLVGVRAITGPDRTAGSAAPIPSPMLQTPVAALISGDAAPTMSPTLAATAAAPPAGIAQTTSATTSGSASAGSPVTIGTVPVISGPTPAAALPAPAGLPLGTLVEVDGWSTTLLRPDYALILEGSVGDLRPSGRFVLTLMAISNNSTSPRRIPADLFTLVDSRGRRYSPLPNASTAYLALYGRGQHGDLALEDDLAPSSGMRSVPILFDIPTNATGLVLTVRDNGSTGWPIEGSAAPATNVGP